MTPEEENILAKQIEIDKLQAKLDKKRENNDKDVSLDEEVLYSKRLALASILEV